MPTAAQSYWAKEYFQRGELELYLGDYKQAIEQYNLALGVWADYANAYFSRGRTYLRMKEPQKAAQDFHQTIRIQPKRAEAYFYLGAVFLENQELEKAIEYYSKALQIDTTLAIAYNYRAEGYRRQGLTTLALEDYHQAIRYGGRQAPLYFGRGKCFLSLQKAQEATQDFSMAIQLEPRQILYYQYRLEASFVANQYTQTIQDIHYLWQIQNDSLEKSYISLLVFCYLKQKDWQNVVQYMDLLPESEQKTAKFYTQRGDCYYLMNAPEKAIQDYQHVLALTPDSIQYRRKCTAMYMGGKDYAKTIEQATLYLQKQPKDAEILYWRGVSHFLLNHKQAFKPDLDLAYSLGYKREDMDLRVQPFVKKKKQKVK